MALGSTDPFSYSNTTARLTPPVFTPGSDGSQTQAPGSDIRDGLRSLRAALDAGSVETARDAVTSLKETVDARIGENTGRSGQGSGQDDTGAARERERERLTRLSDSLDAISGALDEGDIDAAREAFATLGPREAPRPPPPATQARQPTEEDRQGPSEEVRAAVGDLASALEAGDTEEARDALDTLTSALDEEDEADEDPPSSAEQAFREGLDDVGSALDAGAINTARATFASLGRPGGLGVDLLA